MKILLCKYSRVLRNGNPNPKSPPEVWWLELESLLQEHTVKILPDFLTWEGMRSELDWCDTFISVDTYFHHLAWYYNKKGIVVWGKSDPLIFGHSENVNLLKDRNNLRTKQFDIWEAEEYDPHVFVSPQEVIDNLPK